MSYNCLVSIIVPIYNASVFLTRCIQSLICQDYTKIEILLINDGSTDSSLKICEQYKEKDNRIHILNNEENKGVSYTRNLGIKIAKGVYVAFVDADDFVRPDYISSLIDSVKENDFAFCRYNIFDGKKIVSSKESLLTDNNDESVDNCIFLKRLYSIDDNPCFMGYCVRFIIRRDFLLQEGIVFPDCKVKEDLIFVTHLFLKSNNYRYTNKELYTYDMSNMASTSNTRYKEYFYKDQFNCLFYLSELLMKDLDNVMLRERIMNHATWDAYKEVRVNALAAKNKEKKQILKKANNLLSFSNYSINEYRIWIKSLPLKSRLIVYSLDGKCYFLTIFLKKIMLLKRKL